MTLGGGGRGVQTPKPTLPVKTGITDVETLLHNLLRVSPVPVLPTQPSTLRRDWSSVLCFLCGKSGHGATRCPALNEAFPFMLPDWKGGEGRQWLCYDLPSGGSGTSPGGKRRLIRGGGSTARISNDVRPQDHGGGEAQLTFSWDVAGEWPVFHPTSCSGPEDVAVTAMSADAAGRQVDCALPTDSNRVSVVVE